VTDEAEGENLRLARRIKRLESTLEQVEQIRDGNASLLNKVLDELDAERTRSRELLLNVLPAPIVARLDAGESHIADGHDHVAVLMADLVGFTQTASTLSPAELVDDLNELFTQFDEACAERGVEKIKTIGDAYMAVAGLDETATDRVAATADLALDMLAALKASRTNWQIRIGIHAGPVVAGIIGSRKFAYDVWGDAVNVASRLESTSLPNRIQVSQPVAEKLDGSFELESRGEVEIKGKGPMATWFVVGRL
jgi:adenylate cyclase